MSANNEESRYSRAWLQGMLGDKPVLVGHAQGAQGLQLKDHEIAQAVNEVRRIALEYGGTQQLRDRLAGYLGPILKGEKRP